jgi:hypothetical protein
MTHSAAEAKFQAGRVDSRENSGNGSRVHRTDRVEYGS